MNQDKTIHFSGLNGIRAIAAISVVITHVTIALKEFGLDPYIFGAFNDGKPKGFILGGYGVSIFFVLSGFLITYLLKSEKDVYSINIKKFYIRRILRIWPLYYLYIAIVLLVIILSGLYFNASSLLLYTFFAANIPFILAAEIPFIGHYWSLGVEEQFYLFWPWIVKKIDALATIIFISVCAIICIKIMLHVVYPGSLLELAIHVTRFHCMMIGAFGAILLKDNNVLFLKLIDNKLTQIVCWIIICMIAINRFHFISVIDNEFISVVALCLIIGQIKGNNKIINLEINVLGFLGRISYGIYVIHPILIFLFSKLYSGLTIEKNYKYFIVYGSIIGATILLAYLSFTYFESYFLKFKNRFVVISSSAEKTHSNKKNNKIAKAKI